VGPPPRGPATAKPAPKVTIPHPVAARKAPWWFDRARRLITQPAQEWAAIAGEFTTPGPIYLRFLVPMAAIGPVAAALGTIISGGQRSSFVGTATISTMDAVTRGVLEYGLNLGGVYLFAVAIGLVAGSLGGDRKQVQALKIAAYGSTPYWLGGAVAILPKLAPVGLVLALYSVRLYAMGLPKVAKVPPDKAGVATLLVSVGGIVVVLLISAVLLLVVGG
jgi:Yip1 domain